MVIFSLGASNSITDSELAHQLRRTMMYLLEASEKMEMPYKRGDGVEDEKRFWLFQSTAKK